MIPAFNEERRLPKALERIHAYLTARQLRAEVIVVDDGSTDGTAKLVEQVRQEYPEVRLSSNGRNRGKGFSVRRGMLEARGEIALFTDADLSAPIEEADKLFAALRESGCDGCDRIPGGRSQPHHGSPVALPRVHWHCLQSLRALDYRRSLCRHAVWLQGLPARTGANYFRAAAHRGFWL